MQVGLPLKNIAVVSLCVKSTGTRLCSHRCLDRHISKLISSEQMSSSSVLDVENKYFILFFKKNIKIKPRAFAKTCPFSCGDVKI